MIDRKPLLHSSTHYRRGEEIHYFDHDANRYQQLGKSAIAYTCHKHVKRPGKWRIILLTELPGHPGVMVRIGAITTQTGQWFVDIRQGRLNQLLTSARCRITQLPSEAQAMRIAQFLLAEMFP